MDFRFPLTDYIQQAMAQAVYEDLGDGTFCGTIPPCWGVIAFGDTLPECQEELQSVLEDWMLVGLRWGDELPVVAGIDLNVSTDPVSADTDETARLARIIAGDFYNDRFNWAERRHGPGRYWDRLPEVAAVRQLQDAGVADPAVRLFITFVAAMDRSRVAATLWQSGAKLWQAHPELFEPAAAAAMPWADLQNLLSSFKVSQRHGDDTDAWRNIGITLSTETDSAVRRAIDTGIGAAPELLADLKRDSNGRKRFPMLRGPKIGPMWIRMMVAPGKARIDGIESIPVAVDTHIKRVTENLGITFTQDLSPDQARPFIQAAWQKAVADNPIDGPPGIANTCAALDPALWILGRDGCAHCERAGRRKPISSACDNCRFSVSRPNANARR